MAKIKNEKIEKALYLDCYENPENKEKLRKIVSKFKWFKKCDFVDFAKLEKAYLKVKEKYGFSIQYIMPVPKNKKTKQDYWVMSLKNEKGSWIYTVYGMDFEECMLKAFVVFYGVIFEGEKFCLEGE